VRKSIYSEPYEVLTGLLRDLRHEAGLTQTEVADRLGKPQSFVSKYEAGERRLDLIELRAIAGALGMKLTRFVQRFELELTGASP
jgi:transcriptional regulator with XRE-family HTH domain